MLKVQRRKNVLIVFQDLQYFLYIFRQNRFYCTALLIGFASKGAIINIIYYNNNNNYYYYQLSYHNKSSQTTNEIIRFIPSL